MKLHGIFFQPPAEQNYLGHIVAEIYKDQIYGPYLNGRKDLQIMDLGANIGVFSYYASQFAKQVYSVEPAKEHFDTLTQMVKFNEIQNIKPLNFAISDTDGKAPFYHPANKTMFTLSQAVPMESLYTEEVNTIRLDTLFKSQSIEHIDFMKFDIEGTEDIVLGSEGFAAVAPKIDMIVMELHSWIQRHPNQIAEALKANGFKVTQIPNDATILVATK